MNNYKITTQGIAHIAERLLTVCKTTAFDGWLDAELIESKRSQEMLGAWASELEDKLNSGDGDEIEISSDLTKSGHVEWLSVPDDCVVTNEESDETL